MNIRSGNSSALDDTLQLPLSDQPRLKCALDMTHDFDSVHLDEGLPYPLTRERVIAHRTSFVNRASSTNYVSEGLQDLLADLRRNSLAHRQTPKDESKYQNQLIVELQHNRMHTQSSG